MCIGERNLKFRAKVWVDFDWLKGYVHKRDRDKCNVNPQ